ncbi:MAG: peptide chain release factor N(5)-glutamine methyltransferase [Bacteroidota bacterium]|nr:peptide chain release factor N(5)-glutamine methyltransferase [Bacteroidota bacterium]MDP4233721.1 peptide chain release factor N(5)-glutamine methyltransferase [Bacteroidota bacterium]MDP4242360.1 peptide chain release factor N(5)-glutamine methyltransferase [Bacteroidota bacterium]MDP4288687.1 peptide chain release factor N(5)-glutamine methyltransferase [Bacteroidota bacterium]
MTWEELVAEASMRLKTAGIDDAQANAEYMAAFVSGVRGRAEWRAIRRGKVRQEQADAFNELIVRRELHEPLQYILGEWEFFGLPIIVRPGVLIPRPETEILVEEALKEAAVMPAGITIVDVGTGSGAIALAMAKHLPAARVHGVDVSATAIAIAEENQARLDLANVQFRQSDMMQPEWLGTLQGTIHLLLSNPPYVSLEDFETLEPELREHEPREALTDEGTGLTFYCRLAEQAGALLAPSGRLLVELGFGLSERVADIMSSAGLYVLRIVPDLAGIPRVLVASRR